MTAVVTEGMYPKPDRIQRKIEERICNSASLSSVSKHGPVNGECVLDSNFMPSPAIQCGAKFFRQTLVCVEPTISRALDEVRGCDDRAEPKFHDEVGKVRDFVCAIGARKTVERVLSRPSPFEVRRTTVGKSQRRRQFHEPGVEHGLQRAAVRLL